MLKEKKFFEFFQKGGQKTRGRPTFFFFSIIFRLSQSLVMEISWACADCTFENNTELSPLDCAMCGHRRTSYPMSPHANRVNNAGGKLSSPNPAPLAPQGFFYFIFYIN